jgi:hypothetical protein
MFDNTMQVRLVGATLMTKYIGQQQVLGGMAYVYQEVNNDAIGTDMLDVNGNPMKYGLFSTWPATGQQYLSPDSLMLNRQTGMDVVSRKGLFITYRPMTQLDMSYQAFPQSAAARQLQPDNYASNILGVSRVCMGIVVAGAPPGQSFTCQFRGFYEVVGSRTASTTPSHSDTSGLAAVRGALPVINPTTSPQATEKSVIEKAGENILHTISGAVPQLLEAVPKILGMI